MIAEHYAAVTGLLTSLTVYDEVVPDVPSYPYVVTRVGPRDINDASLALTDDAITFRVSTTVVAVNATSARIIADRLHTVLQRVRPIVSTRACGPIRHAGSSGGFQPDLGVTLPGSKGHPVYGSDLWEFMSYPG